MSKNPIIVILSPSPCVTLTLSEAKGKGLAFWLRVNSVKNLIDSISYKTEILPCLPAGRG
jgi:hypothetical protein